MSDNQIDTNDSMECSWQRCVNTPCAFYAGGWLGFCALHDDSFLEHRDLHTAHVVADKVAERLDEARAQMERSLKQRADVAHREADTHRAAADLMRSLAIEIGIGKL